MSYDRLKDPKHIEWAKKVKERDRFQCQICGATSVYLNSHHLFSYAEYEDLRYDVNNGVTLCQYHHEKFHEIFTNINNTKSQFEEYKKTCRILVKLAKKEKK
jgi:5-methylcytosine-specific restriction endonuclease McrA